MDEEPQVLTLKQRIASLNAAHLNRSHGDKQRSAGNNRNLLLQPQDRSPNIEDDTREVSEKTSTSAALPNSTSSLPVRRKAPPLPRRTSSREVSERVKDASGVIEDSAARIRTQTQCQLPPIPVRKEQHISVEPLRSSINAPVVRGVDSVDEETTAHRGPVKKTALINSREILTPARSPFLGSGVNVTVSRTVPPLPLRRKSESADEIVDKECDSISSSNVTTAPPIPRASRPKSRSDRASEIQNTSSAATVSLVNGVYSCCMICRDFSGPDHRASLFPRQHVKSLETLAQDLTSPFASLTDKARAIFTWLHYNIDYNVKDFFSGDLKASTPWSTLQTGLAVCEGYASLFDHLASCAGLESMTVSGHGKGFGHVPLAPDSPVPPYSGNHAWNVVRIDRGEWKLIDSCWGAGHVKGAGQPYTRKFAPERFVQSNEEFGIDHFPNNNNFFFLPGNRRLTWQEYIKINPSFWPYDFERPTFFDNAKEDYSIGRQTIVPPSRKISVHQPGLIRFQFGLFCPHWTHEYHTKKGLSPVFILATGGINGQDKRFVPFEHYRPNRQGGGGDMWYTDVAARELGAAGETLTCFAVTSFGKRQDARGLSVQEFRDGVGRVGMGFVGIAAWDLV